MEKTNIEILKEHNALEGHDLTPEQEAAINEHFDAEEMKTLVKLRTKVMDIGDDGNQGVF